MWESELKNKDAVLNKIENFTLMSANSEKGQSANRIREVE